MKSPAAVFAGKAADKELPLAEAALAVACTNAMETDVTVSFRVALPVPPLLLALSVTVDVPAAVGVPEINPEEVLTDNPAGNPVAP